MCLCSLGITPQLCTGEQAYSATVTEEAADGSTTEVEHIIDELNNLNLVSPSAGELMTHA